MNTVAGIMLILIIAELFNYMTLMYINKKSQISKVSVYSTMHASFTICFGYFLQKLWGIYIVQSLVIYAAYCMIFVDKFIESKLK